MGRGANNVALHAASEACGGVFHGVGLNHEANHRMGGNKEGMEMGIVSHIASHATPLDFLWNLRCSVFLMRNSWLVGIQEKCPRLKGH